MTIAPDCIEDDPRLDGLDERRELRKLARRMSGLNATLPPSGWLTLLVMLEEAGVRIDPESTLIATNRVLERHREDMRIERLAALYDRERG